MAALQHDPDLEAVRTPAKTAYSLQDFEFRWTDGDFSTAAEQLALVLGKLDKIKVTS